MMNEWETGIFRKGKHLSAFNVVSCGISFWINECNVEKYDEK